jgi:hypothetical protein
MLSSEKRELVVVVVLVGVAHRLEGSRGLPIDHEKRLTKTEMLRRVEGEDGLVFEAQEVQILLRTVQHHRCRPSEACPLPPDQAAAPPSSTALFCFCFVYPILPNRAIRTGYAGLILQCLHSSFSCCRPFLSHCIHPLLPSTALRGLRSPFRFHSSACCPFRVIVSLCSSLTNKLLASLRFTAIKLGSRAASQQNGAPSDLCDRGGPRSCDGALYSGRVQESWGHFPVAAPWKSLQCEFRACSERNTWRRNPFTRKYSSQ